MDPVAYRIRAPLRKSNLGLPGSVDGDVGMSAAEKTRLQEFSITERAILLAIHEARARPNAIVYPDHLWVQKAIFLFRKLLESINPDEGPSSAGYVAYDFGPYSEEVEGALDTLLRDKLLGAKDKNFLLTSEGALVAKELEVAKPKAASALRSIVDVVELLTPDELILYVYATNPEWAGESKVKGVLQNKSARLNLARKLYAAQKVSGERAAEIAGIPVKDFLSKL